MNLLALDTSTMFAAVALRRADGRCFVAPVDPSVRHGRSLVPSIQTLLAEASLSTRDLHAFAAGLGPGSYTGLRIGLTAAKTLAYALSKPMVGLDSLEILARGAPAHVCRVSVVSDAQRGDVFTADFVRDAAGGPLYRRTPTRVESVALWRDSIVPGTFVVGPALVQPSFVVPDHATRSPAERNHPGAHALIALAEETVRQGTFAEPWLLEPLYLRRSAAEDLWKTKANR